MAKFCPLMSGSKANATYISSPHTAVLVDAGGSFSAMCEAIERCGSNPQDIRAVAITHEHTDHTKGLKTLVKRLKIPIIASTQTLNTLINSNLVPENAELIALEDGIAEIGDIAISRFATSHDCEGSSGYVFTLPGGIKTAVCTDLGIVTDTVRRALRGCESVIIESNHDINMLKNGPYPADLKMRILSDKGHLSNDSCATLLPELLKNSTTRFVLGHLSQNNNLPALAKSVCRGALADIGAEAERDYILTVAKPANNEVVYL